MFLSPFPQTNVYSPAGSVPLPSCTPFKYNPYLDSSIDTVIRVPNLDPQTG
jgi:hypothetical protein